MQPPAHSAPSKPHIIIRQASLAMWLCRLFIGLLAELRRVTLA